MKRIAAGMIVGALALAAISGCNRVAGTEVGNPEITVAARFAVYNELPGLVIPWMNLKVMWMGYSMAGDSGACWNDPYGNMVDFGADAAMPIAPAKVHDGNWSKAELMLQAPVTDTLPAIIADYALWANPRYTKLVRVDGTDTLRVLFDMPQDMRLKLMFGKDRVAKWRSGDTIMVKVMFDASKWAAAVDARGSFTSRQDGKHARYVLFSADENAAAWTALKQRLPSAFAADTAEMR